MGSPEADSEMVFGDTKSIPGKERGESRIGDESLDYDSAWQHLSLKGALEQQLLLRRSSIR